MAGVMPAIFFGVCVSEQGGALRQSGDRARREAESVAHLRRGDDGEGTGLGRVVEVRHYFRPVMVGPKNGRLSGVVDAKLWGWYTNAKMSLFLTRKGSLVCADDIAHCLRRRRS